MSELSVLIVDDDPIVLRITQLALSRLGVTRVEMCSDAREAASRIAAGLEDFDIVLSDLNMPGMDGIELLRAIADLKFPGGLILLTAEDMKVLKAADMLARGQGLNLLGGLAKPVTVPALEALLDRYTKQDRSQSATRPHGSVATQRALREAFSQQQLRPFVQPRVDAASGELKGMEALARWDHPDAGLLPAGAFVPAIEASGLVGPLTMIMLEASMGAWVRHGWHRQGLRLSVNAGMGVLEELDFPDRVEALARELGFPLGCLVMEITESKLMGDPTSVLDTLIRLRLKGVELAMDDFGTGYSNLAQLKRLPISELKIDRSFVLMSGQDEEGALILDAAVAMGRNLGLRVVVEGVETDADWARAAATGAAEIQGYYVAKPMPPEDIDQWVSDWMRQQTVRRKDAC